MPDGNTGGDAARYGDRPMPARVSIISFSCSALLVATACQGGPDRLSADEFAEQANAACAQVRTDIEGLEPVDIGNPEAAAETVDRTTEIQRTLRDRLDELVPPAAGQTAYDEWIRQIDVVLEQSGRLAEALQAGDAAAQTAANQAGAEAVAAASAVALELGADECVDSVAPLTGGTTAP